MNKVPTPIEKARLPEMYNGEKVIVVSGGDVASCPHCGRLLGRVTDKRNLSTGNIILVNRTTLRCSGCKNRSIWKPLRA